MRYYLNRKQHTYNMGNPFNPVKFDNTSDGIRHARELLYDPYRMQALSGAIIGLTERIEEFAHTQCDYVRCISIAGATLTAYDLSEQPNMLRPYNTAIQIDHISFEKPFAVSDRYVYRMWLWDSLDEDLTWSEYLLTTSAKGKATIRTIQSYDGLAEAVRLEDPAFLRAVKWRDASEYEARQLYADLEELTLPDACSAEIDKMV